MQRRKSINAAAKVLAQAGREGVNDMQEFIEPVSSDWTWSPINFRTTRAICKNV